MNMRSVAVRLLCSFVFLSSTCLCVTGQDDQIARRADEYLVQRMNMGSFSGAVLIAKHDRVLLRKAYGYADVERKIPYFIKTQQPVASITKMFTSMAALVLRDSGRLRLEDPVCKYLDDCPETWSAITIEQLMRHTSGIPDYESALDLGSERYLTFMAEHDSSGRIVENAKKLPLDFAPGTKFSYSNTAYIVLSMMIQKVSGSTFERFVKERIFKPAGMKDSGFVGVDKPRALAKGYTFGDLGWNKMLAGVPLTSGHLNSRPQLPTSALHGDASMYTTLDDLLRWSKLMDGRGFITQRQVSAAFTAGLEGYGYGWFVGKGFERNRVRHNGMLPGHVSNIDKYTDDGITIILFSNVDRIRLSNVTRDIAAITLGKPFDMPVRGNVVKLSGEQLAKLEGEYRMADGALLIVKNEPDLLTAKIDKRFTAGLIPIGETEFYFPLADGRAIFTLGEDGRAAKVNLRYSGEDHIAERVK
jgi:CubicO group peptidase (beta-lactamase class C family)